MALPVVAVHFAPTVPLSRAPQETAQPLFCALAQAAHATVACSNATVLIFTNDHCEYAAAPQDSNFTLREDSRSLRRLSDSCACLATATGSISCSGA